MEKTQIISQLTHVEPCEPAVLTIGFFDGVHRGHRHVIRHVIDRARQDGARAVLVTFWPHPQRVLHPEKPKPLLTTLQEKLELLVTQGGLDAIIVMPFTAELAHLTPGEYLTLLRTHVQLRTLIVGSDFAFGHHRAGNISWLQHVGKEVGFTVETLNLTTGNQRISSTRIRELIAAGQMEEAANLLGRPYTLAGTVIQGDKRCCRPGCSRANMLLDPVKLLPASGVYTIRVQLPESEQSSRLGVAYVGRCPNCGEGIPAHMEVHLLERQDDLSDQQLVIEFVNPLREEQHVHSMQA